MKYLLIVITLLALNSSDAREKFYKWTDADGNIHYSETKPANKSVSEVKIHDSVSSSPIKKEAAVESSDQEQTPEQKQVEEYNKALQAKNKAIQDQANCKVARKNLTTLQQTVRVSKKDPTTGERIRMDDTQRIQMLNLAKQSIKDLCK